MDITTAEQDKWVEISERLRIGIEHHLHKISKMTASELNNFTDACNNVLNLSIKAQAYDVRVQKESMPFGE